MSVNLVDVENAMVHKFLSNGDVASRIQRRFYKTACREWIVALESVLQERSPRLGQWADYRRSGQVVQRLLNLTESRVRYAAFEIRTFGQVIEEAEALQNVFIAVIGAGFSGTLGSSPSVTEVSVKNMIWNYETQTSDYDETFKQAYASIGLVIPYRAV